MNTLGKRKIEKEELDISNSKKNKVEKEELDISSSSKEVKKEYPEIEKAIELKKNVIKFNSICSDSGECIAFGKEIANIKTFFDSFSFTYVNIGKMKKIGEPSLNGFIIEIPYERQGYHAYSILKCAANPKSDNLIYEGLVGVFINKKNILFPCFLETYYICLIKQGVYNIFRSLASNANQLTKKILIDNNGIEMIKPTYKTLANPDILNVSCLYSKFISIMIQHFNNIQSFHSYLKERRNDADFRTVHLVNYLYQVYCPLAFMSNEFTHYDLHTNNVLIYHPSNDCKKYVKMIYHYADGTTVEFNTFGIAKIIDYGRCYFNDKKNVPPISSLNIYNAICSIENCGENCGQGFGYKFLAPEKTYGGVHYISSSIRNKSHDLRLIYLTNAYPYNTQIPNSNYLKNVMDNVVFYDEYINNHKKMNLLKLKNENKLTEEEYDFGLKQLNVSFGTPEITKSTYAIDGKIRNVEDMHIALRKLMKDPNGYFKKENDRIFAKKGMEIMGIMEIWTDQSKPMTYTSVSTSSILSPPLTAIPTTPYSNTEKGMETAPTVINYDDINHDVSNSSKVDTFSHSKFSAGKTSKKQQTLRKRRTRKRHQ